MGEWPANIESSHPITLYIVAEGKLLVRMCVWQIVYVNVSFF